MKNATKRMAACAMMAALCVVLMVLGAVLELGMYACPLLAGLCFIPIGQKYGRKYHLILFVATALLSFFLVPNIEENLIFAGLFGWYPILRPVLQKLPGVLRWLVKLAVFNGVVVAIEWLVMTVLAPEAMADVMLWVLLALGNVTFIAYDFLIPRLDALMGRIVKLM
jgi:hypothetical protein